MKTKLPELLMLVSLATAILGGVVSVFQMNNLWLAGTQWVLIAILFAIYSLFAEMKNRG
jgi:hypothetical protein